MHHPRKHNSVDGRKVFPKFKNPIEEKKISEGIENAK